MKPARHYLARQPITDDRQQLVGYELLYRNSQDSLHNALGGTLEADTALLTNLLGSVQQTNGLLEDKLVYLNVGEAMLMSEMVELLPANRVRLEVSARLASSRELLARMRSLRQQGFTFSLDHFELTPSVEPFLDQVSAVKLDVQRLTPAILSSAADRLRHYPLLRIAERVEAPSQFRLCQELGLEAFQGYHFAHPETLTGQSLPPGLYNVLRLLSLVRADAPIAEIETILKTDLALSLKLLRFVNSAAAGQPVRIQSFAHAVTVLGYRRLYRWLTLLLITSETAARPHSVLVRTATVRARTLENLAERLGLPQTQRDILFICGLFSLLDVTLDVPMQTILRQVALPAEVSATLEHRTGRAGDLLALVCSLERMDTGAATTRLAQDQDLDAQTVNDCHCEAIGWAETLGL
ncbi:EAL and HDOD domain-containing protein [Crenobacter intestini]|uniref:HDOD domain-containing protein n=1 Tax=Crenobacter intestini TaxID=2563443 RepID=A0A4T0V0G4_9NEIS|nr:HDOD domain-containing protein [Crenobacter intestini]TIC84626.1 HDOD domain-containing protein [Crenobacter intestini]